MNAHDKAVAGRPRKRLAVAIAAALVTGAGGGVSAETFTVSSPDDNGPGTLRDAVEMANKMAGPDVIEFNTGLGEIVLQSQINISEELTISGPAGARQIIRGSGSERLLAVPSPGIALTLSRVELAGGRTFNPGGYSPDCYYGYGDGNGGALCARGDVTITGSTVRDNQTFGDNARGGGLFIAGNAVIENSTIADNQTSDGPARGGGLFVGGDLVMRDSRVTANSTAGDFAAGGGIAISGSASIYNSVIAGNTTTGNGADGGGLTGSAVAIAESTLAGNSATGDGGGLRVFGTTTLINATLSGNSAEGPDARGGGIAAIGANLLIANSTVTANSAAAGGGGIDTRVVEDFTYALRLDSSVLAGNSGPAGNLRAEPGSGNLLVRAERSLFGDAAVEINDGSTASVFSDAPGLEALADNGCAQPAGDASSAACVLTHMPLISSPVIDTGDNTLDLNFDQRGAGFPRTRGAATDIGAFEAELPPMPMPAALVLDKTDGDIVTAPGEALAWQLTWGNVGERPAETVEVRETVPAGTRFDAEAADAWVCEDVVPGSQCVLPIGAVAPGQQGTATFAVEVETEPPDTLIAIVNEAAIVGVDPESQTGAPITAAASDDTPVVRAGRLPVPARGASGQGTRSMFGDFNQPGVRPQLGLAVAGLGDFDGDGLADVAVGAPGRDSVQVVLGRPFPSDALPVALSEFPGEALPGFRLQADDGFGGLGDRLAGVGDTNGDGLSDLLLADAALAFDILVGRGRGAFLQPGFVNAPAGDDVLPPSAGVQLLNAAGDDPFATRLGGGGDFDGDGFDDMLVTTRRQGGLDSVWVVFGSRDFAPFADQGTAVQAEPPAALRLGRSARTVPGFGSSMAAAGDFNGDGLDDIVIGEPAPGGRVHVIFGDNNLRAAGEGQFDMQLLDGGNGFTLTGGSAIAGFGARVAGIGDFDGDGFDDLAVHEDRGPTQPGRVHIVFGSDASLPASVSLGQPAPLDTLLLEGLAPGDRLGSALAGAGDLDSDGRADLLLGAPGLAVVDADGVPVPGTGEVLVLLGRAGRPERIELAALDASGGYRLAAPQPGSEFGAALDGAGDVDGDGVPDLLVAAPGTPIDGIDAAGQVWIISGALRPAPVGQVLEIVEFATLPEAVVVGETITLSWSAVPDDDATSCSGSGLPGTAWNGAGKPAAGSEVIDSSALPPGDYTAVLECQRDGEIVTAGANLDVLIPSTELVLDGARIALPFGDSVFVQFDVANVGPEPAQAVALDVTAPNGYTVDNLFRLSPDCTTAAGSGEVNCDAAAIADWQCDIAAGGAFCSLAELPVGAAAAVLVELSGQGAAELSAAARADNAGESTSIIALEP